MRSTLPKQLFSMSDSEEEDEDDKVLLDPCIIDPTAARTLDQIEEKYSSTQ